MKEYANLGTTIVLVIAFAIFFSKIKGIIREAYGRIDKIEFAGFLFTGAFFWMIWKEGTREHEWHVFGDTYILIVAFASLTGLGLRSALDGIKQIRGVPTVTETKREEKTDVTEIKVESDRLP